TLPYFFVIGMGAEQVFRAYGDTLDPSWSVIYLNIQMGVSAFAVLLSLITAIPDRNRTLHRGQSHTSATSLDRGILTLWGAAALGSLLFLQLSLLATPNAITGRTQGDYTLFVPIISVATLLPLIPTVRKRARDIIAPFDSSTRGWMWLILLALLIVIGTRITGLIGNFGGISPGAIVLAFAQLFASLTWWWIAAPQGERKRNFTGLWLPVATLIFALFVVADIFTYEYAFVADFAPPLDTLNEYIPPLLRGFRGVGTGVMLVAVFLSITPILQYRSAIPWRGGTAIQNFFTILLVAGTATAAGFFAQPPVIQPVLNVDEIRVGTYNIHGGYDEFFNFTLPDMARTIERSGAEVVLLQDVDAGRLTSFGVDEGLWLARNINNPDNTRGMDMRYYGTIEGLHGLAILSRVPIIFEDGITIPGVDRTTGLQRVQIRPDEGAVTLYNTHLGFLLSGDEIEDQESNQRQQLDLIFATIEQHIERDYGGQLGRALLAGTFNNVPDSPLMQYLASTGFNDPFADANPILSNTLVTAQRQGRIDYLWLWEQSLRSTGSGVIDSNASEHRMAFVGIQLR
ncbi:MAG: endonuclease/exonuclease/phosphatase family protein, partial [Aggregatilineales bacterium]